MKPEPKEHILCDPFIWNPNTSKTNPLWYKLDNSCKGNYLERRMREFSKKYSLSCLGWSLCGCIHCTLLNIIYTLSAPKCQRQMYVVPDELSHRFYFTSK